MARLFSFGLATFQAGLWFGCLAWSLRHSAAGAEYQSHARLTMELQRLAADTNLVHLTQQGWTIGHRELWLAEIGVGNEAERKLRPALLVVAGIEGNDLAGSASAVHWIEQLSQSYATNDFIRAMLARTTVYVFPRMNPDGAESYFAQPRLERSTNLTPTDDDHDGLIDEDGPEDLNGDGFITSQRVQDPEGEFILDPLEPRLLLKADRAKGERGAWKLLSEGIDNDKDEQWNEDGLGGVNLNRNFPFAYEYFGAETGRHPVSEVESRALADFVVAHPNIAVAFTFGAADNLVQAPKGEPGGKRPPGAISEADLPFVKELGETYRETLGLKKEMTGATFPGTFSDWIYFHRGRLSLAAKAWSPALQLEVSKTPDGEAAKSKAEPSKKELASADGEGKEKKSDPPNQPPSNSASLAAKPGKEKPAGDKRGEQERAILKWFDTNAPAAFVPWKEFKHPDFPGQKVEIGGWAPFAHSNPPVSILDDVVEKQARWLTTLLDKLPRIGLRKLSAKPLGSGVFELIVQVENAGYLPTALAQGALTREVLPTRIVLHLDRAQILAGLKTTLLGPIPGSGGMHEERYIVRATGSIEVSVVSALGGSIRQTVELKEAQ